MKLFGVSYKKALRVMDSIKSHRFFIYNPKKNCLFAKSFKTKETVPYGRKKRYEAQADFCRKLKVGDDVLLRDLVRELRNTLLIGVIQAKEARSSSQDNFSVRGKFSNGYETDAKRAIPQRLFASAIGLSRSSACRYIKKLEKKGDIKKGDMVAECVIHCLNEETLNEYFSLHKNDGLYAWFDVKSGSWSAWKMYGYEYAIINRPISDSYKNVIHNYKRKTETKPETSCELDGAAYWAKHS